MRRWLAARCASDPEATALVSGGARRSWRQLEAEVAGLAAGLEARGLRAGEVLAVDASGRDFAVALHAVDALGAVLLPVGSRLTPDEVEHQLRDGQARALLCDDAGLERAQGAGRPAWAVSELRRSPPLTLAEEVEAEALLALVYTSGTSGRPRGVELSRGAFDASARASEKHLGRHPQERWLLCMPLHHVGGLSILIRSCVSGFPVVAQERFDAERLLAALESESITLVSMVPTMLARVLDHCGDAAPPASLRCVLLGGAGAPSALLERASRAGWPVAPTYGLSEAASQVATCPLEHADAPGGKGAAPLPGTRVRIGAGGEILVQSPSVMRGYRGLPEESARTLREGWLHTGDLGRLDAEGRLHVVGRLSDRIISGGENVDPAEVEAVLALHPEVSEAGVAGVPDPTYGERPCAWIVARPGCRPRPETLRSFCRSRLAAYKVPAAFHLVESLPRTHSGKLRRGQLRTGPGAETARAG